MTDECRLKRGEFMASSVEAFEILHKAFMDVDREYRLTLDERLRAFVAIENAQLFVLVSGVRGRIS